MALNNPYALQLDGVDDRATVSVGAITAPYTFEIWINPQSFSAYNVVFFQTAASGSGASAGLRFENGRLYIYLDPRGSFNVDYKFAVDTLVHVAYMVDVGTIRACVNGVQVTQATYSGVVSSDNPIVIGANSRTLAQHFHGIIDELRLWSYARTQDQIHTNMYKKLQGNEPGLALYYRCDEGTGTTLVDSSPNGLNGTITGATWVQGLVDLSPEEYEGQLVTDSITFRGHASGTFGTPIKTAVDSITFRGHASMFLSAIKTAVGSITFRGAATMQLAGLVLRELEGVYQISSSEIVSRNQPVLSTDLANHIEVWINPLIPATAAEEVYRSKEPELIPSGESKTFNLKYNDEPVIETVASLAEAGVNLSITDVKYYGGSAEITVANSGTTEQSCLIVITGKPLELQGRRKIVVRDEESILDHGLVKYEFDSPLVQDEPSARDIGQKILRLFSVARANVEITWRGDPALELADICQIPEFEKLGVSTKENFYIARQQFTVADGGLGATMAGRKVPQPKEGE